MRSHSPAPHGHTHAHRLKLIGVAALTCVSLALTTMALTTITDRALALYEQVTETGVPGLLQLRSNPGTPVWHDVRPGTQMHWFIEASLTDADAGNLALELAVQGDLAAASAMRVTVTTCTEAFDEQTRLCADPIEALIDDALLADFSVPSTGDPSQASQAGQSAQSGPVFALATLKRGTPRHVHLSLTVPAAASADAMADTSSRIGVGLHASGVDGGNDATPTPPATPEISTPGDLPVTGADIAAPIMLGAGLAGLGLAIALWRTIRRTTVKKEQGDAS